MLWISSAEVSGLMSLHIDILPAIGAAIAGANGHDFDDISNRPSGGASVSRTTQSKPGQRESSMPMQKH